MDLIRNYIEALFSTLPKTMEVVDMKCGLLEHLEETYERYRGDEVAAYSRFIGALCAAAKKQKRVTAHEKAVDNEKYTFRCFLLRLGFIGDEYKQVRKILLKNLAGNSAFKSGAKKNTEVCDDVSE